MFTRTHKPSTQSGIYRSPKVTGNHSLEVASGSGAGWFSVGERLPCTDLSLVLYYSVCPGKHLAEASVWIAIATFLAAFEISPWEDEFGNQVLPKAEYHVGLTRCVSDAVI